MRYVRYAVLFVIMVAVVLLAVANKDMVALNLLPRGLQDVYAASIQMPLFLVILLTLLLGVVLGYVLEWGREMRQRREAAEARRTILRLEKENESLRRKTGETKNDVLAILN